MSKISIFLPTMYFRHWNLILIEFIFKYPKTMLLRWLYLIFSSGSGSGGGGGGGGGW